VGSNPTEGVDVSVSVARCPLEVSATG